MLALNRKDGKLVVVASSSRPDLDAFFGDLFGDDPERRRRAARDLGEYGEAAVQALSEALTDIDPEAGQSAALALARIVESAQAAAQRLSDTLKDEHQPVAAAAHEIFVAQSRETIKNGASVQQLLMEEILPSREDQIKALFADLPGDARERLEAVPALYKAIRQQAAADLQSAVAQLVKHAGQLPYDEMAELTHVVNEALRAAQLGIRDPDTGIPASLKPSRPRPSSSARYLLLRDTRAGDDGRQNSIRLDKSPRPIELMPNFLDGSPDLDADQLPGPGR